MKTIFGKQSIGWILLLSILAVPYFGKAAPTTMSEPEREARKSGQNFKFSPLIAPAYTPELGFLLAAGGLASFKTDPLDSRIQRSSVPFTIGYSSTGAIVFNAKITSFWMEDNVRLYADLWYKNMADNYWGVGYEDGKFISAGEETTAFDRTWWQINPKMLWKIIPNLYAGINLDFNRTKAGNIAPGIAQDENYLLFGPDNYNAGAGIIIQYDTRDIPVNAWQGIYLGLAMTGYDSFFKSDNNYKIYEVDYRQYQQILSPGSTLTWQLKARVGDGSVPYGELSQLGTPFDLRGYTWGRYRDSALAFGLLEYRHMFGEAKKHGMVAWGGAGSIASDIESFNHWLPNWGVGYRLEMQPRMNLRLDLGFGEDSGALYVNFNEAF